jgi:magnesium-transporting ATPase (P-type)
MTLSATQMELLEQLKTNMSEGLTREEASARRQDDETFNTIDPPIKCPAWICCLLPCIKSIPSMKKFREIQPEDAEILRESKWTRYDAASLVRGDIIKVMEGDIVPADCALLTLLEGEILVDMRTITGEDSPRSIVELENKTSPRLYYGGRVLQGSAVAVVVSIGPNTLLASLIRQKNFPPKQNVLNEEGDDEEVGISLLSRESM